MVSLLQLAWLDQLAMLLPLLLLLVMVLVDLVMDLELVLNKQNSHWLHRLALYSLRSQQLYLGLSLDLDLSPRGCWACWTSLSAWWVAGWC